MSVGKALPRNAIAAGGLPPALELLELATSWRITQVIQTAAKLGIADLLADGTKSIGQLAGEAGAHERSLYRFMRALVTLDICKEVRPGLFKLAPAGAYLRSGVPGSVLAMTMVMPAQQLENVWNNLLKCVKTGEPSYNPAQGKELFKALAESETAGQFNRFMLEFTRMVCDSIIRVYDFSKLGTLVDVGGGWGGLVVPILKAFPKMRGILFDLPISSDGARKFVAENGVGKRCQVVAGDFFESVPEGGDAYVLKSIIHDWDDEHSLTILRNCRSVMGKACKLLLVERLMPVRLKSTPVDRSLVMSDLNMLVAAGGCERTRAEFAALLASAGFKLVRVVPSASYFNVLEAVSV